MLWTIVVINLANVGITLSLSEQFLLTAVPNLIGSALRLPYTFAVPRFGGREWTMISASLLLIPTALLAVVVPSGWLAEQRTTRSSGCCCVRGDRRLRRRQLRLLDGEHLVLLSRSAARASRSG